MMKTRFPYDCVLARHPERLLEDFRGALDRVTVLEDSRDCFHAIERCTECGQLYLHDYEDAWSEDGDRSWSTLVPVFSEDEIRAIRAAPGRGLTNWEPRIGLDTDSSGKTRVYWVAAPEAHGMED